MLVLITRILSPLLVLAGEWIPENPFQWLLWYLLLTLPQFGQVSLLPLFYQSIFFLKVYKHRVSLCCLPSKGPIPVSLWDQMTYICLPKHFKWISARIFTRAIQIMMQFFGLHVCLLHWDYAHPLFFFSPASALTQYLWERSSVNTHWKRKGSKAWMSWKAGCRHRGLEFKDRKDLEAVTQSNATSTSLLRASAGNLHLSCPLLFCSIMSCCPQLL